MSDDLLLTRDEVLGGLPARRAACLLFLIESRTGHLVERARHTMQPFRSEDAARERELAFVEAFALGREPPLRPTIQGLEHHALQWVDLVPDNPRVCAAVARLFGQKYQFTAANVPALRAALGLDKDVVQQAHQRLYGEPLETIYTKQPSPAARLRWTLTSVGNWLESLPPFWTAFALTLSETIGTGILALPIALAGVGPMPAIILLVVLGLVNVITVAWMAETASRTASIRYGGAYFGRMVKEYLGGAGALLLMIALMLNAVLGLVAYSIGLSATLASATGIVAAAWVVILFMVAGFMVSRDSVRASVASALTIGALNIVLVLVLAMLGIGNMSSANLAYVNVPGFDGAPFELSVVALIFGAILVSYFGHTTIGNCAAVVLRRDPSARSLIWGVVAAQVIVIALYSIWILGVNGAIAPGLLANQAGTALEPLADVAGPSVQIVGSIFVLVAMGSGLMQKSEVLINAVRDWFPKRSNPVVLLARGQGRLLFEPRGSSADDGPRLVLTYLGLAGDQPRLCLQARVAGRTQRVDRTGAGLWEARDALDQVPDDVLDMVDLAVESITADADQVRLQISSTMRMRYEGDWTTPGLDLAGLLHIGADATESDPDGALLRWMLRQGEVSLNAVAVWTGQDADHAQNRLQGLVERGAVREVAHNGLTCWRANVARRRARQLPESLRQTTDEKVSRSWRALMEAAIRARVSRASTWLHSDLGHRSLEYSPLVVIAMVTEWLVLTDRASFAGVLSFSGTIAVPIFAGLFPCLLLVASRRKGDLVPNLIFRLPGQPWLTIGIYTMFLFGILLHGLAIWERPVERIVAIAAGVFAAGITVLSIRRGAFNRRIVITLREDRRPGGRSTFGVVSGGHPIVTDVRLDYADGVKHVNATGVDTPNFASLRQIAASLRCEKATEIKIWANRITPEGSTESLPAQVRLTCGTEERHVDLRLAGGQVLLPCLGDPCAITLALDQPSASPTRLSRHASGKKPVASMQQLLTADANKDV